MTPEEKRNVENFVLSRPLGEVNDPENLQFLAGLLQDHDHFAEKLQGEPDRKVRRMKYEAMVPYLTFKAHAFAWYELPPWERGFVWMPHYV